MVYVDCDTGAGAGLKLGELITTGRGVVVVVVVVRVGLVGGRVYVGLVSVITGAGAGAGGQFNRKHFGLSFSLTSHLSFGLH